MKALKFILSIVYSIHALEIIASTVPEGLLAPTVVIESINGPKNVCYDDTETYSLTITGGASCQTYSWSVLGGTIIGSSTHEEVTVNWTSSGSITAWVDITYECEHESGSPHGSATNSEEIKVATTSNPTITGGGSPSACESDLIIFYSEESLSYWQYQLDGVWSLNYGPSSQWSFKFFDYFDADDLEKVIYFKSWSYPTGCTTGNIEQSSIVSRTFYKDAPSNFTTTFQPQTSICESNAEVTLSNLTFPDGTAYNGEEIEIEFTPSDPNLPTYVVVRSGALSYTFNSTVQAKIMHDDGSSTNGLMKFQKGDYTINMTNVLSNSAGASCSSPPKIITFPDSLPFSFQTGYPIDTKSISCNSANDAGSTSDGQIQVNIKNGKGNYIFKIFKGTSELTAKAVTKSSLSHTFIGLSAGSYNVQVVDDCGSAIKSGTVDLIEPSAINVTGSVVNESCKGTPNDGAIDITVSGGTSPYSYQWSGGSTATTQDIADLAGSASGVDYLVTITDAKECVKSAVFTLYEPDTVVIIEENVVDVTCSGASNGSIDISVAGGTGSYSYAWSNGEITEDLFNISGTPGGKDYTITITDTNGCTGTQTIAIYEPAAIAITGNVTDALCSDSNDGAIEITNVTGGTGFYFYEWSTGETTKNVSGLSGSSTGVSYTLTVTDERGCTAYSSFSVSAPDQIMATALLVNESCYGMPDDGAIDITAVSGGNAPYTFSWSTGATTEGLANIAAGDYSVEITDAIGCSITETYTITEPLDLLADALISDYNGAGVSCAGATDGFIDLYITGGTSPYTYSWSNGKTTANLSNTGSGLYSVDVADANGCTTSLNDLEITAPEQVTLVVTDRKNVDCFGNATGGVSVVANGGMGTYEYTIDDISWQTSATFTGLSAGDYTVKARDANSCSASVTTIISEPEALTGTVINIVNSTCGEDNGSAEAQAAGGTERYTYTWNDASNVVVSNASVLSGVGGGVYTVSIRDANGCSIEKIANISSADGAQVTATNIVSTSCSDSHDGQATLEISGSAPFDVKWENGETSEVATALFPGDNVVNVTDVNGCVVVEVINIPSPDPITYTVTSEVIPNCHDSTDGSLSIMASGGSGGFTYDWGTGKKGSTLENISSGIYSVTISDINGCILQSEVRLNGVDPLQVSIVNSTTPTCVGDSDGSLTVNAAGGNGGYTYEWSSGHTSAFADNIPAGIYDLMLTDNKGCSLTETFELADPDPFVIDMGADIEICTGSSYKVTAPVAEASYTWTADNGFKGITREVVLSEQGTYKLNVTNGDGCEAEDSFALKVTDDLLHADFLMVSKAYAGDTIVLIDISWPIPENLTWTFQRGATVLMKNKDFAEVTFDEPGIYTITIEAGLAACRDFYTQTIEIFGEPEGDMGGRMASKDLIDRFSIYPNPGDGVFEVDIGLSRREAIQISMVDLSGNKLVFDQRFFDQENYKVEVNLPALRPGIYLLMLKAATTTKMRRVMIR